MSTSCAGKLPSYCLLNSLVNPPSNVKGPRIIWIQGPPGCGKSYLARITIPKALGVECYLKSSSNKWWEPFTYLPSYVVVEDIDKSFKESNGWETLKFWGDMYPFSAEFKGGSCIISPNVIIITSNYFLEDLVGELDPIIITAIRRRIV